jgi:hypothetical protein
MSLSFFLPESGFIDERSGLNGSFVNAHNGIDCAMGNRKVWKYLSLLIVTI